jgi:hypothetical protein
MKKTFDTVAWMRKRRAEIDKEDEGLSWKEKDEKTRRLLKADPLWIRLKTRVVKSAEDISVAAMESRKTYRSKGSK